MGQDWGARAAQGTAAVAPERVERLVSLGGYALSWDRGGPPSYRQLQALWYQFLLQSGWGEGVLRTDPRGFSRYLWAIWSPTWTPPEDDFAAVAAGFDGPDFASVVLSAYRGDPVDQRYADLEPGSARDRRSRSRPCCSTEPTMPSSPTVRTKPATPTASSPCSTPAPSRAPDTSCTAGVPTPSSRPSRTPTRGTS